MNSIRATLSHWRLVLSRIILLYKHGYLPNCRWLWNERQRQRDHVRDLDMKALKLVVSQAMKSTTSPVPVQIEELAEGGSNKVFRTILEKQRVVVKIPDPIVPSRLSTASEVATLDFLRSELKLPVPQVFSWSDHCSNPIGCEYIIMEEAAGTSLDVAWPTLGIPEKLKVVDQILSMQKSLITAANMFGGYGSLYFTHDAVKLGLPRILPVAATQASRYSVSMLAHHSFPDLASAKADVYCGPWSHPHEYLTSLARSSVARLKALPDEQSEFAQDEAFRFPTNTVSDMSRLAQCDMLEVLCQVIPFIVPSSREQCLSLMWHRDLHLGNIFVSSEGVITSIVDWQDIKILPSFLQVNFPVFMDLEPDELLLDLPDNFGELPPTTKSEVWQRFRDSMLQQYYLAKVREALPWLAAILEDAKQTPIRRQVASFAQISHGQDADGLLLRELLLRIQRNWTVLVADTHSAPICPINITGEELVKHQRDGRIYNEFQDLLKARRVPVAHDGWVPIEEFDARRNDLLQAIEDFKSTLDDQQRSAFMERLARWNISQ